MTKPIEPGCLVVVLYSESSLKNEGKVGVVQSANVDWGDGDYVFMWSVKCCNGKFQHVSGDVESMWFEPFKLLRIDGDVEEESECDEVSKIKEKEVDYH